jgi:hypothetical protein
MNKLSSDSRARIIMSVVEGNSIASTCRMTGAAKMTVLSLLAEVGTACAKFHESVVRDLTTERVQADEVWSFCAMEAKERSRRVAGDNRHRLDLDLDGVGRGFQADDFVARE